MGLPDWIKQVDQTSFEYDGTIRETTFKDVRGLIIVRSLVGPDGLIELETLETYRQGYGRAGHYHPYEKRKDVIWGAIAWRIASPQTKEETEWKVSKTGDKIVVPSNQASLFIGLEPYTILQVPKYGQKYIEMPYQPYRDEVNRLMIDGTYREELLDQLLKLV